jgi:N-acetylneuraminic acid mutarotase
MAFGALLVAALVVIPLSAVAELPGERPVKELLGMYSTSCEITGAGKGAWRREADMLSVRDGPASATIGDDVYLVGGIAEFDEDFENARSDDTVERFDIATGEWEELPPLPRALNHAHVGAVDGVLYVLGGALDQLRAGEATGDSWRFDPAVGRWEEIAPMPTARGEGGVAVVDGRIYVIGGRGGGATLDTVESYDPRTDSWSEHASMPTRRNHLAVAVDRGLIYALGGRQEDDVSVPTLEVYDPAADRWEALPDMPGIKAGFALHATPSGLVALGGENLDEFHLYGDVLRYRPQQRRWDRLEGMPEPRHGYGSAYVDGRLYIFGGSKCSGFSPRPESYSTPLR